MTVPARTAWMRPANPSLPDLVGPMFALQAVAVIAIAAALGIGSAWLAVEREIGFEAIRIGSWTAWPTAGAPNADPYVRARFARSGELPLNIAEGIAFAAREDSTGQALLGACEYRVVGRMPAAQWWTLTAYRENDLALIANPANRYGFDSTEVMRRRDGSVEITLSPRARPGNWIPTSARAGELRLMLRLYDTPLATGGSVADIEAPVIERVGCP